ncbi:MAG: quinone-dependent dihydroorotate dehydrogenase, partial [Chloroflexi bacterium]|nr:quinone-dependent dihydroorotate dehydrogenase [Chloroflexota bacterium]
MYTLLRPLLFRLDAERAHDLMLTILRTVGRAPRAVQLLARLYGVDDEQLHVSAFGLTFKNPVGLAAGYDKNGVALRGLSALGFGHIEVGTLTLKAQQGNPKPRVHRVAKAHALINSMGFPNEGVESLRPDRFWKPVRSLATQIGINIGKGKDTPLECAADDYCALLRRVYTRADYVTLNVSSPNTLGLRQLQARAAMEGLLREVTRVRDALSPRVPLLVKIAPDLNECEIDDVLAAVHACGVDGIVATNTTVSREGIPPQYASLRGGLSGAPLHARALEVIRFIARRTDGKLPIATAIAMQMNRPLIYPRREAKAYGTRASIEGE